MQQYGIQPLTAPALYLQATSATTQQPDPLRPKTGQPEAAAEAWDPSIDYIRAPSAAPHTRDRTQRSVAGEAVGPVGGVAGAAAPTVRRGGDAAGSLVSHGTGPAEPVSQQADLGQQTVQLVQQRQQQQQDEERRQRRQQQQDEAEAPEEERDGTVPDRGALLSLVATGPAPPRRAPDVLSMPPTYGRKV